MSNLVDFFCGRDHFAPSLAYKLGVAASVVGVVVRVEYVRECPSAPVERFKDWLNLGRVDGGGGAGRLIVDEIAVVIAKAAELLDNEPGARE
eukprot:scaffold263022_cov30-Tisochrysis_lutea.AAC.2